MERKSLEITESEAKKISDALYRLQQEKCFNYENDTPSQAWEKGVEYSFINNLICRIDDLFKEHK